MTMTRFLSAAALAIAIISAPALGARAVDTDTPGSIDVGGVHRTYVAHVPANLGKNVPLVLVFHGHYMTGEGQSKLTHLDAQSDKYGFIVVYPDGIHRGWNDGRARNAGPSDIAFTQALIADFSRRYSIDPKRIYAAGFSNGATFTEYLGCALADRIAAIAPVSGPMPADIAASCHPSRPLSVLEIGGTTDPIMPYGGGQIAMFGHKRGAVLSTEQTVAKWAANARCGRNPATVALPAVAPGDGTSVTRTSYEACAAGTSVALYTVTGGGHTWPDGPQYLPKAIIGKASDQLDASQTIVEFFLAHPMR